MEQTERQKMLPGHQGNRGIVSKRPFGLAAVAPAMLGAGVVGGLARTFWTEALEAILTRQLRPLIDQDPSVVFCDLTTSVHRPTADMDPCAAHGR